MNTLKILSTLVLSCGGLVLLRGDYESDFQAKAETVLEWTANVYQPPGGSNPYSDLSDPEKYTGPKMVARFAQSLKIYGNLEDPDGDEFGADPPNQVNANEWLKEGSDHVENLFHFRFLGNVMPLSKFGAAPGASGVKETVMIDGEPVEKTYADAYVESVLRRTDNYNAFTGEGTENHINMGRPTGWIYARLAEESAYYQARLAEDPAQYPDPSVKEQESRAYLTDYARQVYAVGTAEYDSSVYGVFNVSPWICLYEATAPGEGLEDGELHDVARAVLDWHAAAMALKYRYGIFTGASVRGEGTMSRYDRDDQTDFLLWLWFGDPADEPTEYADRRVRGDHQPIEAAYAAASGYRPPLEVVSLARKEGMANTLTRHGRGNYLMSKPSESLEQLYVGPTYTLGSATFPYGGWASGNFRVNQWKLVAERPGAYTPMVVAGNNGLRAAKYSLRNAWLQVVQDANVLLQLNRVPVDGQSQYDAAINQIKTTWLDNWYADFTARWDNPDWGGFQGLSKNGRKTPINAQDDGNVGNARTVYIWFDGSPEEVATNGAVRFARVGDTYLAIRAVDGDLPNYSSGNYSDFAAYDELGGLILEAGSAADAEYGTFGEFQTYYLANSSLSTDGLEVTYTAMDGRVITATYEPVGDYTEPEYDWAYGVTSPVERMFSDSYAGGESWEIPGPASAGEEGTGRVASWSVDPDGAGPEPAETHGPSSVWPLFEGPNLKADNGVMHIWDGASLYTVDYSGTAPVFSSGPLPVPHSRIGVESGEALIQWPSVSGLIYQLERAEDLAGPWESVGDPVTGSGSIIELNGGSVPAADAAFWRIVMTFD